MERRTLIHDKMINLSLCNIYRENVGGFDGFILTICTCSSCEEQYVSEGRGKCIMNIRRLEWTLKNAVENESEKT